MKWFQTELQYLFQNFKTRQNLIYILQTLRISPKNIYIRDQLIMRTALQFLFFSLVVKNWFENDIFELPKMGRVLSTSNKPWFNDCRKYYKPNDFVHAPIIKWH